ncbi:MAG TPA: LysM domain-containing protein [Thermoanaerobaculia bacterium]|nr:LysM domain-containing protein [Thermoanaerobaculia bacterium]
MSGPVHPTEAAGQGLKKAYLEILIPRVADPIIPLRFNPTDYKIEKKNQFAEIAVPGLESPAIQFVRGESEKLSAELLVDTSDTLEDVKEKFVDRLRGLMRIQRELHAPPIVSLTWDCDVFVGVLERLEASYVLFSPEGVPLRAKLSITLLEHRTVGEQARSCTKNSPDVEKTWVVRRGDSLASVAAGVYGDPRKWREIARANAILDPRRLAPGTVLTVPRLRD